jgi:hypothetical protein
VNSRAGAGGGVSIGNLSMAEIQLRRITGQCHHRAARIKPPRGRVAQGQVSGG